MIKTKTTFLILTLSFVARALVLLIYGDNDLEYEWRILIINLREHNTLAIKNFGDLYLPNLWMPPLYAYFLYAVSIFFESLNNYYINLVLIIQCLLSSVTAVIFYKILKNFYKDNIAIIGSLTYSLLPINLYSASQISSVTIVMFLSIFFYYFLIKIIKTKKNIFLIIFSVVAGMLILSRREFILFYIISIFFLTFFYNFKLKKILLICIITFLTTSPYVIRNYLIFDKITIQAGFGYNVWKAYNPMAKVEGYSIESKELKEKINLIQKDIFYRINEDKLYLVQGLKYIKENPLKCLKLYFNRLFSYYFIDLTSSQPNYYNFFHIGPNILLSIFFTVSLFRYNTKSKIQNYFLIIFLSYCFLISFFAVLPRYKLYIIPIQILFSLNLISKNNTTS